MDDKTLIQFLLIISDVNKSLTDLKIALSKEKCFTNIKTNCGIYTRGDGPVEISLGIDVGLIKPLDNNLHSVGMSFRILKKNGMWNYNSEIGWSRYDLGFDEVDSVEKSFESIETLLNELNAEFSLLRKKYLVLLKDYKSSSFGNGSE